MVSNLADSGKKRVKSVTQSVESRFVYSLIRGKELSRWRWSTELSILLPQNPEDPAKALSVRELKGKYPKTFAYFHQFEEEIRDCALLGQFFDPDTDPFYSSYNVGEYTFAPIKVAWKEICPEIEAAVIEAADVTNIPDHKLVFVPFQTAEPAYFLCALLNSSPIRLLVRSYAISGSISGHIMEYARIPAFDRKNSVHMTLAHLGKKAHDSVAADDATSLAAAEADIDKAVAGLWGITAPEMKFIRGMLIGANESARAAKPSSRPKKGTE